MIRIKILLVQLILTLIILTSVSAQTTHEIIPVKKAISLPNTDFTKEITSKDNVWSPIFHHEDYFKIVFVKNLTKKNDITLYPKIIEGNPSIEVYSQNGAKVATFTTIDSEKINTVFLRGLIDQEDTFELHVIGGSVKFDYIVDPFTDNGSLIQNVNDCGVLNTTGATYTQNTSIVPSGNAPCINITAPNITYNGNGFNISNSSFANVSIYATQTNTTIMNINISSSLSANTIQFDIASRSYIKNGFISGGYGCISFNATKQSIIENMTLKGCNFRAIFMEGSSDHNIIQNNTFLDAISAINIETYIADNTTVQYNTFAAVMFARSSNVRILKNTFGNGTSDGRATVAVGSGNANITNNTFFTNISGENTIYNFGTISNILIEGNSINNTATNSHSVSITSSTGYVIIRNNTFGQSKTSAIYLASKSGNTAISNNTIRNTNLSAIIIETSNNILIENNIIENTNASGIYLNSSQSIVAVNNTISSSLYGITLDSVGGSSGFSSSNNLSFNFINNSRADALFFKGNTSGSSTGNYIINVTVLNTNVSRYDLFINNTGFNSTNIVNSYIANYSFANQGVTVVFSQNGNGAIQFTQPINSSSSNLTADVLIRNGYASINASRLGLNKTANITFLSLTSLSNPKVFRDDTECPSSVCSIISPLSGGALTFNASSWAHNYTVATSTNITSCTEINTPNTIFTQGASIVNLPTAVNYCIVILAPNVTYNGNTFTIDDHVSLRTIAYAGIYSNQSNVTVKNVTLSVINTGLIFENALGGTIDKVDAINNGAKGLWITGSRNITINNSNSSQNSADAGLYINESYGIIIVNNSFNTNNKGINIVNASNITIQNTSAIANYQEGLDINTGSSNITVRNTVSKNNTVGIVISGSSAITLTANNFSSNGYSFNLDGNSADQFNHSIASNNDFGMGKKIYLNVSLSNYEFNTVTAPNAGSLYCIACVNITYKDLNVSGSYNGIYIRGVENITLNNLTISGAFQEIMVTNGSNTVITNSTFSSDQQDTTLMNIESSNTTSLVGNRLNSTATSSTGAIIESSSGETVLNNIIEIANGAPFSYSNGYLGNFTNNTMIADNSQGGVYYAFEVVSSDNSSFVKNTFFSSSSGKGTTVSGSSNNEFIQNNITASNLGSGADTGLLITSSSSENTLINNTITSRLTNSLRLEGGSNNNQIINNTLISYNEDQDSIAALSVESESNSIKGNYIESLVGTTVDIRSSNNLISGGIINNSGTGGYALALIGSNAENTTLSNITLVHTDTDVLELAIDSSREMLLQDMIIGKYQIDMSSLTLNIENTSAGKITFNFDDIGAGISTSGSSLSSDIKISYNYSFINASSAPDFNLPANVTFYSIPTNFASVTVYRNNVPCTSCYLFTAPNEENMTFNVTDWGAYSLVGTTTSSSGSSGGSSSGGSSNGGGGGSSESVIPESSRRTTVNLDDAQLETGVSISINKNSTITLSLRSTQLIISPIEINQTGVLFKTDDPVHPTIWVSRSYPTNVDLDNDGFTDAELSISESGSASATLKIRRLKAQAPQTIEAPKQTLIPWSVIVIAGLITGTIIIISARWYYHRKKLLGHY